MPLGASVTYGVGSSTGNSYRKALRDLLLAAAGDAGVAAVDFVGSVRHGDFADADVEAYSGYTISQIAGKAAGAVPRLRPNVVLVDAGTNNCNGGGTVADGGAQVGKMVEAMFAASPGVAVLLATVLANPDARQDGCRVDLNRQYAALVAELAGKGQKILLVDMRSAEGPTTKDLADSRHPNDVGYGKMAKVWYGGIQTALEKGLITPPVGATGE
jgi:lysophospholipase L1-like esterase